MPKSIEGEWPGQDRVHSVSRFSVQVGPDLYQFLHTRARDERRYIGEMARIMLVDAMHAWYRERGLPLPAARELTEKATRTKSIKRSS